MLVKTREILNENGKNEFPLEKIIEKFNGTNKSLRFDGEEIDLLFLKLSYGKSETLFVLMLLYPTLDYSNKFHMDHMYPKSKMKKKFLKEQGISEEKLDDCTSAANNICNLQLLEGDVNFEKGNEDFGDWFARNYTQEEDKKHARELHYIPDMEYTYANFSEFAEKRRKKMKERLEQILGIRA